MSRLATTVFILHYLNWLHVFGALVHFASMPTYHRIILFWCDFYLHYFMCMSYCTGKTGKVIPIYAMQAYRGSEGIGPLILNLRWLVSLMHQLLYSSRMSSRITIEGGWMCPRASLDIIGRGKSLVPTRTSTPNRQACSLVTVSYSIVNKGIIVGPEPDGTIVSYLSCMYNVHHWILGFSRLLFLWLSSDAAALQSKLEQNLTTLPVLLLTAICVQLQ
jgi:hypothetical protein